MTSRSWVSGACALALVACAAAVLDARREWYPRPAAEPVAYVRTGSTLAHATLGFDALAADVYWIRAVQHFGRERQKPVSQRDYRDLFSLLDIATTLDPQFVVAYQSGALLLAEPAPYGPGRLDRAITLLEKGQRADPARWQFAQYLGFLHYWYGRDPVTAGRHFAEAARMPGAPNWMQTVATRMYLEGGAESAAVVLLSEMEQSDDRWIRDWARERLAEVKGR